MNSETKNKPQMIANLQDLRPDVPKVELASQGGIDVIAAVRKRPYLTLGIMLVCVLAGAKYVLRRVPHQYHAEAAIYVSPTYFKNLQQDREQLQISYSTLVNQQMLTIKRFDILGEALDRLQKQGIQWRVPGESDDAAVERLAEQLDIQHIPDSYEVLIGLNGPSAEQLAPILNTITDTYLEKGKQDELLDRSTRLAALTAEQNTVAPALQQKLDEQTRFAEKLTTVGGDKATLDDTLLTGARKALEDAHQKRVEAEAQLAILQSPPDGKGNSLLSTLANEAASNDPNARPLINGFLQRTVDLQKMTEGLTPEHPLRKATEKELVGVQSELTHLQKGLADDESSRLLVKTQGDVERARHLESELSQEVDTYLARVQGEAKEAQTAQGVNDEVDRLRRQQAAITAQIDALNIPGDSAGYLRIFSAARTPLAPTKSDSKKLFVAVLGMALLLGVGTAVAMDLFDQRIFVPAEVKRAIGFPPVGIVLDETSGSFAFAEEHFRRLVNGIQRGVAAQSAKSIVFTPVRLDRTPDMLLTDIGRVLVARGVRTAILDANPMDPEDEGIVSSARSERLALPTTDRQEGDRPEGGNNDPKLPARIEVDSSGGSSPAPLISRISGLLETLKSEYDLILIDTPPLAASADTEFLASICDITLLVAEGGEATRRELIRSAASLGRIGAPSVGVIMTQVRLRQAGRALKKEFTRFSSPSWSKVPDGGQA
jgi:capsular polysaccharide biosynthesis protein